MFQKTNIDTFREVISTNPNGVEFEVRFGLFRL